MFAGFSCLWVFFAVRYPRPIISSEVCIIFPICKGQMGFLDNAYCIYLSVFCCLELSLDSMSLFLMFAGFNYLCVFLQLSLSD